MLIRSHPQLSFYYSKILPRNDNLFAVDQRSAEFAVLFHGYHSYLLQICNSRFGYPCKRCIRELFLYFVHLALRLKAITLGIEKHTSVHRFKI